MPRYRRRLGSAPRPDGGAERRTEAASRSRWLATGTAVGGRSPGCLTLLSFTRRYPRARRVNDLSTRLGRARFRAWHRGTREADLMIGGFFDRYHAIWNAVELEWFEALLE